MKHPEQCPNRYAAGGCPDLRGPAAGDLTLVGFAGDTPEMAQAKILARVDDPAAPAPLAPITFHVGWITRVRRGQIVAYRDAEGRRHRLEGGPHPPTHVLYTHREAIRIAPMTAMAQVAKTSVWAEAVATLGGLTRDALRRCRHTHP